MTLFKLKNQPVQKRPTQIGNTTIGRNADLAEYGFYEVTNNPPSDPPADQEYIDSGNGTYDEETMTYTADWILVDRTPIYEGMTHLQFLSRFDDAEVGAFETLLADARNGTTTLDPTNRGIVLTMGRKFNAAQDIRLDNSDTQNFVQALVSFGILTQSRATEVLTLPYEPRRFT